MPLCTQGRCVPTYTNPKSAFVQSHCASFSFSMTSARKKELRLVQNREHFLLACTNLLCFETFGNNLFCFRIYCESVGGGRRTGRLPFENQNLIIALKQNLNNSTTAGKKQRIYQNFPEKIAGSL